VVSQEVLVHKEVLGREVSQELKDLRGNQEVQDHRANVVNKVNVENQEVREHLVSEVNKVHKVLLDHQVLMEGLALLAPLELLVFEVRPDYRDKLDVKENVGQLANQAPRDDKGNKEQQDQLDQWDHKVHREDEENLDNGENLAHKVHKVNLVHKVKWVHQEHKDNVAIWD